MTPNSRSTAEIMELQGAAPPAQPPDDNSYFFNLLNRDVRNLIYSYMTLGRIRTKDATQCVGFRGTCRQAKKEAEEEGYELRLPCQLKEVADFVGLKELTLITNAPVHILDLPSNCCPRNGLEDLLSIDINNITIHYTSQQPPSNPKDTTEAAVLMLSCMEDKHSKSPRTLDINPLRSSAITISWDYRNCTREDEYESLPTYQLKKELRNRGVASSDIPERKPAVIDALLSHDPDNPQTIAATTSIPNTSVPQALVGKRFYVVLVDGSLDTMEFEGDISPFHADTNLFDPHTSRFYADTSLFYATNRRNSVGMVRLEEVHDGFGGGMCEGLIEDVWDEISGEDQRRDFVAVEVCWNGIKHD